jgi:hypothetical protein
MGSARDNQDHDVLSNVIRELKAVSEEERARLLATVLTYFGLSGSAGVAPSRGIGPQGSAATAAPPSVAGYTKSPEVSAKQFMLEKQPKTAVERIACLAYYLTHYRNVPQFKTIDLSKLNTEAAQPKFTNAAYSVRDAVLQRYLAPAQKKFKQLSAMGEQYVTALPDRTAARAAMTMASPRSRKRGGAKRTGAKGSKAK